jgi:hypothetical protein
MMEMVRLAEYEEVSGLMWEVAEATQTRNEAYHMATTSDDELFHFYLYDWHVKKARQDQLLEVSEV